MISSRQIIRRRVVLPLTASPSPAQSEYARYTFTTCAGGDFHDSDTPGSSARHRDPLTVAVDTIGNLDVTEKGTRTLSEVTPSAK